MVMGPLMRKKIESKLRTKPYVELGVPNHTELALGE